MKHNAVRSPIQYKVTTLIPNSKYQSVCYITRVQCRRNLSCSGSGSSVSFCTAELRPKYLNDKDKSANISTRRKIRTCLVLVVFKLYFFILKFFYSDISPHKFTFVRMKSHRDGRREARDRDRDRNRGKQTKV